MAAPVVSPGYEPSGNQQIVMRGHIMKRQQLLQLADCRLEWEGEGEEREVVGRGDKWGEMEDKKGGMEHRRWREELSV